MAQSEFRPEITTGAEFGDAVTLTMIAADTSIALFGPVVLADASVADLPHAASTTSAGNANVIGVCTRLPRSGTITADVSDVEVTVRGRCKVKVADATVNLNDALETSVTAGIARVQPAVAVRSDTLANLKADVVTGLINARRAFATALTTVSSGANSIICADVGIQHVSAAYS